MTDATLLCGFCTAEIDTTKPWTLYRTEGFTFGTDDGRTVHHDAHAACPACGPRVAARDWPAVIARSGEVYVAGQLAGLDARRRAIAERLGTQRFLARHFASERAAYLGRLAGYLGTPIPVDGGQPL